MLLNLTLAPAKGWEDVEESSPEPRTTLTRGLIPLLGITAIAVFARAFHFQGLTAGYLITEALTTFIRFFISYYIALFLMSWFMPSLIPADHYDEGRISNFCSLCLGLLAVISILTDCVPVELSLVRFLPVYVIIVMWQGRNYLSIPTERQIRYIIYASLSILAPLGLLDMLFGLLT
ncbi:MAG: hypothetical protein K2L49_01315 [Muribaculaceae bacterium]|nr:hypothetical protein [Muribaculaceae bacterium]